MKIKAGSDDKFRVVKVTANANGGDDIASRGVEVMKISSADIRNKAVTLGTNKDGDSVEGVVYLNDNNDNVASTWDESYYLVNTSGIISKKKTAARDGDDWYFYTNKDQVIVAYINSKVLKDDVKEGYELDIDFDNWDDWTAKNGTVDVE